jgi:uncharacterized repeat protein (TIGR03803 family)
MGKFRLVKTLGRIVVFCAAMAIAAYGQTFTRLVKFNGSDGARPRYGALTQGTNGNLFGTTESGGAGFTADGGSGTIYQITPSGKVTTIYNFCSQLSCADGAGPYGGLTLAANGNFYGGTYSGGTTNLGTAFEFTPQASLTTLYTFCSVKNGSGDCLDGTSPLETLFQATNGNLYGLTNISVDYSAGTIFQITPAGKFTTIHSFGTNEAGGLIQASNGSFYGVTLGGDNQVREFFQLSASGQINVLYTFAMDQGQPRGLIQGADGNFYGTTDDGGAEDSGTFYQITPSGSYTQLYSFCSQPNCTDGGSPSEVIQGTDGNFYGTTYAGGSNQVNGIYLGYGTVFQITPAGVLTTLYMFCPQGGECADGAHPLATVTQSTDGNFYGTTYGLQACPGNCGTAYKLSMGLPPFVKAVPNFGKAGQVVMILGNNLTGATSVTFNGVSASFKVVSSTFIKAQVPVGTGGGTIQVTTPSGTLSSNAGFQALQ